MRATVFPPALGPVIKRSDHPSPILKVTGTTASSSSGWRASFRHIYCRSLSLRVGALAAMARAYRALAIGRSSLASSSTPSSRSLLWASTFSEKERITLSSSRSSAKRSSRQRLPGATAAMGSTKIVAPLSDTSWTIPGRRCFISVFTRITMRPLRWVMRDSWRISWRSSRLTVRSSEY